MRLISLALLAILATGCGGDDAEDAPPPTPARSAPGPAAGAAAPDGSVEDTVSQGLDGQTPGDREVAGSAESTEPSESMESERLYTIQVAAFTDLSTAEAWEESLRDQDMPVWIAVAESGGQTFYRLRIGVVPTVSDARRLGGLLTARYNWPVWVAPLTPADRLPPNAVEATRRLLGTG